MEINSLVGSMQWSEEHSFRADHGNYGCLCQLTLGVNHNLLVLFFEVIVA